VVTFLAKKKKGFDVSTALPRSAPQENMVGLKQRALMEVKAVSNALHRVLREKCHQPMPSTDGRKIKTPLSGTGGTMCSLSTGQDLILSSRAFVLGDNQRVGGIRRADWYSTHTVTVASTAQLVTVCGGLPWRLERDINVVATVEGKVLQRVSGLCQGAVVVVITASKGSAEVGFRGSVVTIPIGALKIFPAKLELKKAAEGSVVVGITVRLSRLANDANEALEKLKSLVPAPPTLPSDYGGWDFNYDMFHGDKNHVFNE
jgi:hypothetical protein